MADLHHAIEINVSAEKVYEAITTQKGLRSWWTRDSVTEPRVGSIAEFGFNDRAALFRMRIDELTPPKRIVWYCLGDDEEWKGTRLIWDISPKEEGTTLHLLHAYWRSPSSWFATCNTTWGALMYRLKAYLEGRKPGPQWRK